MKKALLLFVILSLHTFAIAQKKETQKKKIKSDLILVKDSDGFMGIINSEGEEIVPTKYIIIYPFEKDKKNWARVVGPDHLVGYINTEGEEIVPTKYIAIYPFGEDKKNWAKVIHQSGYVGYINSDGEEIVESKYVSIDVNFKRK